MQNKHLLKPVIVVTSVIATLLLVALPHFAESAQADSVMTEIDPGDLVLQQFASDELIHLYSFTTEENQPTMLALESLSNQHGAQIQLQDMSTGEMIAQINDISTGMCLRLPKGRTTYMLEIKGSGDDLIPYWVMTWPVAEGELNCSDMDSSNFLDAETVEALLADGGGTIPMLGSLSNSSNNTARSGNCMALASGALNVNVRSLPNVNSPVIGWLTAEVTGTVLNTVDTGVWLNVNAGGTSGWVATSVVNLDGNCTSVPVVNLVDGQIVSLQGELLNVEALLGDCRNQPGRWRIGWW